MLHRLVRFRLQDSRSETIWLTAYADLMTNLMLVFLALFGLTLMGDEAVRQALLSMNYQKLEELIELQKLDEMDKITTDLRETFKDNYEVTITEGMGVARISFGDSLLFDVGSASMKKEASGLMGRLAESLREAPFTIVVEGHTDSIPLKKNAAYKNNWDLSLSRSMSIVNLLIAEHGMTPNQLAAAAYGENKPIAGNETEIGRRRNRRVEIALFKNFPLNREVNNER